MVKYYEFNNHEYYALIKAYSESEAVSTYYRVVAGESVEEVEAEGSLDEIEAFDAFVKYSKGCIEVGNALTVKEAIDEFANDKYKVLLIDGSLL